MDDWQHLQDYAFRDSDAAFTQLVEHHLGLVHSAALRQVQDPALAADVTQAVFLLLARKARSFPRDVVLAGWLFRTTRFVASRALRAEHRRQRREQEAYAMQQSNPPDDSWNRLAPELDEGLARLGAADRDALLLRFGEGRNHREVGLALGLNEEAAKKRVNRALDRLRGFFLSRGFTLTAVALGSVLTERLVAVPPGGLLAWAGRSPWAAPTTGGGKVATLVHETVSAWRWVRMGWAAVVTTGVVTIAALMIRMTVGSPPTGSVAGRTGEGLDGGVERSEPSRGGVTAGRVMGSRVRGREGVLVRVISAGDLQPIPNAHVPVNQVVDGVWRREDDLFTDAGGFALVPMPAGHVNRLDIGASVRGWGQRFMTWREEWEEPLPPTYTFRLEPAGIVGGTTIDPRRKPVSGVDVWLRLGGTGDAADREPQRERPGFVHAVKVATTDRQGRWSCGVIPLGWQDYIGLEFRHPDHVPARLDVAADPVDAPGFQALRQQRAEVVLQPGLKILGRVTDREGQPISGAEVVQGPNETGVKTDGEGGFVVRQLRAGDMRFAVTAAGFSPGHFTATAGGPPVAVALSPGGMLRVRMVTTNGEPIPGARLVLDSNRPQGLGERYGLGEPSGDFGWEGISDADGLIVWSGAPHNETLSFTAAAQGYRQAEGLSLRSDGPEQIVTLPPAPVWVVTGNVVDAVSRRPVSDFKAVPGHGFGRANFDRSELRRGTNGSYRLRFIESVPPAVQIEAPGYETATARPQPGPDGGLRCDFMLRRESAVPGVRGRVWRPDGSPAAAVEVVLGTLDDGILVGRAQFMNSGGRFRTHTDDAGRFTFPPARCVHTVAAISADGFGRTRARAGDVVEVHLEPFGTLEGVVRLDGQPLSGRRLMLIDPSKADYVGAVALHQQSFETETRPDGLFRVGFVPVGDFELYLNPGEGGPVTDQTKVTVRSGETVGVVVGESESGSRTVRGQLAVSGTNPISDWRGQVRRATLIAATPVPEPPPELSDDDRALWLLDWHQSEVGRAIDRRLRCFLGDVADDGVVTFRGVPSGDFVLRVSVSSGGMGVSGSGDRRTAAWSGAGSMKVKVPLSGRDGVGQPMDLGEVPVTIRRL